jgi:cobalt-zinc-cadmium efflux system outer membrane protein
VQANANVLYDDGTSDTTAGVQLGVPLQVFNRNQGNIRQARGELSAARQALKRLELNLTSQLADVVRRHANARQQVVRYGDHIVPNAREALELTQQGYEEGEFNYLVVLIAQVTYTRANLAYLAALGEAWEAKIEIDGMLLTGSLNGGVGAKGTNTTAPLGSGPGPLFLPWK